MMRMSMVSIRNAIAMFGMALRNIEKEWRKVMDNYFAVLNGINVNEKTERRKRTNEQHL